MPRIQFDSLDKKILSMLSENARIPFLEIARECGVSGAAIHQRIQKLMNSDIIQGFETLVNPSSAGYETCAYIGFFLKDPGDFDTVVSALRKIPEVVECHFTTGKYDLLIKLYARNNDHLLQIIHGPLQAVGAGRTETLISFKEEFRRPLPINSKE
ncbi:MAG: Lrp/AsnC ligand binding domain-containing protein [Paramuribaculum sp.]|nr:Lrp/AsnC ligand binding domain-containing protein [Paramuribaculum sp.]